MNKFLKLFLIISMFSSYTFAGFGNLAKVLFDEAFIDEKLAQKVFSNGNEKVVKDNLIIALDSFKNRRGKFKVENLRNLKNKISNNNDLNDLNYILKTLEMDPDNVSADMLVDLSNKLARLSNDYGLRKVGVISCLECSSTTVADGVKYKLNRIEKISFKPVRDIFKKIFSRMSSKSDSINLINSKMREQKLGRISSISGEDSEKLAFYVSIETLKDGAAADLVPLRNSINKLYADSSGNIDLFSEPDSFKMWKLPSMISSQSDIKYYTGLIDLMSKKKSENGLSINEALDEILDDLIKKEKNQILKSDMIATKKNLKKHLKCL